MYTDTRGGPSRETVSFVPLSYAPLRHTLDASVISSGLTTMVFAGGILKHRLRSEATVGVTCTDRVVKKKNKTE